jgi:leucyl-tRNA synthetase
MLPIIPHFASECLESIDANKNLSWPETDKRYLTANTATIVVQINGKKRSIINTKIGVTEKELIKEIEETKELQKFIDGKSIFKSIYIKDKLINLIIK